MPERAERLELAVFSSRGMAVHAVEPGKQLVVGRADDADIPIDDVAVSRRHAVFHAGPPLEVEDLGSANGTFVSAASPATARTPASPTADQSRVRTTRAKLGPGDTVFFGGAIVTVRAVPRPSGGALLEGFDAVVRDPALLRVYDEAARAAALSLPVLLLGETGVGKDVLARLIHRALRARRAPFVPLNCAALPESHRSRASSSATSAARSPARTRPAPGIFESAQRRHRLPRRDRRAAARHAGQAPARARELARCSGSAASAP